jgi:cytochrome c oxidase cbb3-type subunit 3
MTNPSPEIDPLSGTPLHPHSWDGIGELETPPPRWWRLTYLACVLFAVSYWIAYPAWPIAGDFTRGLFGWSSRASVEEQIRKANAAQAGMNARLRSASVDEIRRDPDLMRFAVAGGRAAFGDNCAQCHGIAAQGQVGYPNLLDDDWLWGGGMAEIERTIRVGIRSPHPDTHNSQMPAFGSDGLLDPRQIDDVAEFVLSLGGTGNDAAAAERGRPLFAEQCVTCHGEKGEGNREVGAPRLSDQLWLYGGDKASVVRTITLSRQGVMPSWQGRLSDETIRKLTLYVHALGGGE